MTMAMTMRETLIKLREKYTVETNLNIDISIYTNIPDTIDPKRWLMNFIFYFVCTECTRVSVVAVIVVVFKRIAHART